jgi:hypothetical protein
MVPPLLRPPNVLYVALSVVTPLSYLLCLVVAKLGEKRPTSFIPCPSVGAAMGNSPVVFGCTAIVVIILLIWNAWRCRVIFVGKARSSKLSPLVGWLPALFSTISSLFYAAMSFLSWADGARLHLILHFACLAAILAHFTAVDWIFAKSRKEGLQSWVIVWDGGIYFSLLIYGGVVTALFYVNRAAMMTAAAVIGHAAIALLFARFAGLGVQIVGPGFFGHTNKH